MSDEVIFSLRAPEAKEVYLSRRLQPVESDRRADEARRRSLRSAACFLVAGEYRYQFVVDGKAINDPDNPQRTKPAAGGHAARPLVLIERGNWLVLSTGSLGQGGSGGARDARCALHRCHAITRRHRCLAALSISR
jgi:hypothetical protein